MEFLPEMFSQRPIHLEVQQTLSSGTAFNCGVNAAIQPAHVYPSITKGFYWYREEKRMAFTPHCECHFNWPWENL